MFEQRYQIIRFRFQGRPRVIKRGLTLEEAKAHCNDPRTRGEGWFDGFDHEPAFGRARRR